MITVTLFLRDSSMCGFEISGHSTVNADDIDGKLVCAAVSSAAIMTANTVCEIIQDAADVEAQDGYLRLVSGDAAKCASLLDGFRLHICSLRDEYPDKIQVIIKAE